MTILAIKTSRLVEWTFTRQTANTGDEEEKDEHDEDMDVDTAFVLYLYS